MQEDHAIIVGLKNYPGLASSGEFPQLAGPENDANAFEAWALSPEGGAIPKGHVYKILSSEFPENFPIVSDAKPADAEIIKVFVNLRNISEKNKSARIGPRVGRRLYIFMAGHGIAPTPYGDKLTKEAALLCANVEKGTLSTSRSHIPGVYAASWFGATKCFDEIFLFMDCCRDQTTVPNINAFLDNTGNDIDSKYFFAFATKWSRRARERAMPDEQNAIRGIFTKTLLLGLSGGAAERDPADPESVTGIITFESLQGYLTNNMKKFIDPAFSDDPRLHEPDINYSPVNKTDIITRTRLQTFPATIEAPPGATGNVDIFSTVTNKVVKTFKVSELPKVEMLSRESYILMAIVDGNIKYFPLNVKGVEGII
jgi:hypothetical protein